MTIDTIVLRKEFKHNEFRTPIVPKDVELLISFNFRVFIEKFENRCYTIEEYIKYGGIPIETNDIYKLDKSATLIVGLKDINFDDDKIFAFKHLYFAHCYKNQVGSQNILNKFKISGGLLYDLEYLVDDNEKRLVSFGYYAGFMGALLGIKQYTLKHTNKSLQNLMPTHNIKNELIHVNSLMNSINLIKQMPKIAIIGPNGRCGSGATKLFNLLNLNCTVFDRQSDKSNLEQFDIIINCIFLNKTENIKPFVSVETINKFFSCTIVDVSCDCSSENNPIRIYDKATTHENPVLNFGNNIDLIAINNLPTLIPIESSNYFSERLVLLLIQINSDPNHIWKNNFDLFVKHSCC